MPDSSTAFLEPESERVLWHQQRRRAMVFVGLCFAAWLALFGWLLIHPSATESPARKVKNALFGQRVTEAVERAVAQAGQEGSDQEGSSGQGRERRGRRGQGREGQGREGQGQEGQGNEGEGRDGQGQSGRAGQRRSGQGAQGGAAGDQAGDQDAAGQPGEEGAQSAEGGHRGQGTRRRGASNLPANEQHPENNGPDLAAPPERSIGWLDRFFGVQRPDAAVIQAGEGGSGDAPGAGNTNNAAVASTNPVAAEFTQDAPAQERPELTRPPQPRNTNLPAIAATNATINDRMEQLLTPTPRRPGRPADFPHVAE